MKSSAQILLKASHTTLSQSQSFYDHLPGPYKLAPLPITSLTSCPTTLPIQAYSYIKAFALAVPTWYVPSLL